MLKETDATIKKSPANVTVKSIFAPLLKSPVNFIHQENLVNDFKRQPLLINPLSYNGPCIAKADINGDGREDLFIGGATGFAGALYIQKDNKKFVKLNEPALEADAACEDVSAVFFDANDDGKPDLL
ncbi:MAG: VCBS repeat-containing protein [Segetibacter sp.]